MEFMNHRHLRVTKPRTYNGLIPKTDPTGSRILKKTVFLPLSARKFLETENAKLPATLKMIIEEVPGFTPAPIVDQEKETLKAQLAEMEAMKAELAAAKKQLAEQSAAKKEAKPAQHA